MFSVVSSFFAARIGRATGFPRAAWLFARVIWEASFAFCTEEVLIRAGSLAFTTLVTLVPFTTVALRFMKFYGIGEGTRTELEQLVAQYLLPAQSQNIVRFVLDAAEGVTQNVGLVGLASFCVTLMLLAREVEGHVLKICNRTSTWGKSLLHYFVFLLFAPTGLTLAVVVAQPFLPWVEAAPWWLTALNYPFILASLVVALMLRAFSGYALRWPACFSGAAAAAVTSWAAWKACLVYFGHSTVLSAYGALACVPAFLLWVFVAWCCVLYGAQVAAKTQGVLDDCRPAC